VIFLALVTAGLALAGCGKAATSTPPPASSSAAVFPVTAGGVTLSAAPTHIVSLSPTATEMLFAVGAGSQVTAVDDQSDFPAGAPKTNLSGFKPNAEAIAAKNPDLVVISEDTEKIKEQLTTLKIPVYQAQAAKTLDDTYAQLRDLGALTGHAQQAGTQVQQLKDKIDALVRGVPKRAKPLTYYYELDPTLFSVTSKTFIGSLFTLVGLRNIADAADPQGTSGGYPQLSAESVIQSNPDLIFLADTVCCQQSLTTVKARPGWSTLTAVSTGQVVAIPDSIASRWGPRVDQLVKAITDAVAKAPPA
jgi:iron complex transport system substrate-binding protein